MRNSSNRCWAPIVLASLAVACGTDARDDDFWGSNDTDGSATDGADAQADGSTGGTAADGADAAEATAPHDDDTGNGPKLDVGSPQGGDEGGTIPGDGCQFIDVLFVVDISASMQEEKSNLAANFPSFVAVLDDYVAAGNALGYRLGVTNSSVNQNYDGCSTTMGFDGVLTGFGQPFGGGSCATLGMPWLDGPAPGIAEDFSCIAENPIPQGGGSDCGKERPLGVMERFVDAAAPGGPNDGFYRGDDSLFVVVNLTDEDEDQDYTDTTPAQTKAKLDAFVGGEDRYVAVTIAGPTQCESEFGEAIEATVLKQFTDLVPNGMFGDICQGDLSIALSDALDLIQASCDTLPPPQG